MKIDKKLHKLTWRIQKGCNVEWFDGSKKGSGVVKRVISEKRSYDWKEPTFVVVSDGVCDITIDVDKVRIIKTENTLKKEKK